MRERWDEDGTYQQLVDPATSVAVSDENVRVTDRGGMLATRFVGAHWRKDVVLTKRMAHTSFA